MIKVDVVNADADGTIYREGYGNLSINVVKLLDEEYKYHGLFGEVSDVLLDFNKGWEERVTEIADIVGKYKVSRFDDISATSKLVKSSNVSEEMKEVLEKISPKEINVFTGSNTEDMCLYINKLRPVIPNTKIRVFGTNMEHYEGIFTGKVLELWNSSKRAKKAKELTGDRISIGFGNSKNDLPMLNEETQSYFLTGYATAYKVGCREGSIVYTDLKSLPLEVNNFLKEVQ